MTAPLQIAETECWHISGLRDAQAFFRAVPQLLPEATHMFLEGAPAPDIVALISTHAEQGGYGAPAGTWWSWPQRNQRFILTASSVLFAQLSEAAAQHAEPEICSRLHFYRDAEPLSHWFDAFDEPLFVSKVTPLGRVEQFCLMAGGALADPLPKYVLPHRRVVLNLFGVLHLARASADHLSSLLAGLALFRVRQSCLTRIVQALSLLHLSR